jgi:hypothetical protein
MSDNRTCAVELSVSSLRETYHAFVGTYFFNYRFDSRGSWTFWTPRNGDASRLDTVRRLPGPFRPFLRNWSSDANKLTRDCSIVGVLSDGIKRCSPMEWKLLSIGMMLLLCCGATAKELVYQGKWNTTNRKLDGVLTCVVTQRASHELQGHFYGTWQGALFDYTVHFTGAANDLRGTATIDGAEYKCRAWIDQEGFRANFSGDRYTGTFELKRTDKSDVAHLLRSR